MNDRNRKEMMLVLLLATACSGNAVDLGHGGGGWIDVGEGRDVTEPQTFFETEVQNIYGVAANDTTLFTLLGTSESMELVACPVSDCAGRSRRLYRETAADFQQLSLTPIVHVGGWLYWMMAYGEPSGIVSCPIGGCDTPVFVESLLDSGWMGGLAGDDRHVYWIAEGALHKLAPADTVATVVRKMTNISQTGRLVAVGDFVHFTDVLGTELYRVRKDGSTDAELLTQGEHLTGLDAAADTLYFSTQALMGSIFNCPLGSRACESAPLVENQRWPGGIRTDGSVLFWANGSAVSSVTASEGLPATLWSCVLPGCAEPRLRANDVLRSDLSSTGETLRPATFTFSRDFVFWIESSLPGRGRIRRLAR